MWNRMYFVALIAVVTLLLDAEFARGNAPAGWYALQGTSSDMVKDNETGLIWQRGTSPTSKTWAGAKSYCQSLGLGGYTWRLPTRAELVTLRDVGKKSPAIDEIFNNGGFVTWLDFYWAITPYVPDSGDYWIVHFNGGLTNSSSPGIGYYVRCVR